MMRKTRKLMTTTLLAGALVSVSLTACYMDVKDGGQGAGAATQIDTPGDAAGGMPAGLTGAARACTDAQSVAPTSGPLACYQANDFTWRTSCRSEGCQQLKVYVHYMLTQDLGTGLVAHVEAFDNPGFQGSPISSVRIANFAGQTGQWREADVYLAPGEYYMRAYLSTADDQTTPYQLGDMRLVGGQPVGIYGALSGAQSVLVAPASQEPATPPVDIFLDKLFEKPGSAPETNAHLRLALAADPAQVPDGRTVHIELRKTADLSSAPAAAFAMTSQMLLIQGRAGKAEFISPSLPEGNYLVFVYIDANGNDVYDEGELSAVYKENGQPFAVAVTKDRTAAIGLTLTGGGAPATPPAPSIPPAPATPTTPASPAAPATPPPPAGGAPVATPPAGRA